MPHRRYKKTTSELLVELQTSHDIVQLGNECARFNHKKNEELLQFIKRQASSRFENIVHDGLLHFEKHSVIAGPWQTTLALLFQQLTAERESILIPNPHHPGILAAIKSSKRSWIQYKCKQSEDWRISFEHLEAISSFNSKVILLSNPHHPTGKMYSKAELLKVLTFAQTYELTVIELCLYHPGETFISIQDVARECMPESRVVSVYSRQNDYSRRTPTWVNYHGVTPIELPTEPEDSLILAYFSQGVTSEEMQQQYHDKIQFFELFQHVPHVEWVYPDSGSSLLFCMVPGISVKSADHFQYQLLKETHTYINTGSVFGCISPKYFQLYWHQEMDVHEVIEKMQTFFIHYGEHPYC